MYSGLARQSASGSLHFAVAMSSGFCRQSSTVNPFCVIINARIIWDCMTGCKLSPWRCNRDHYPGGGPRPRPPDPLSAPRAAGTGAGPGQGRRQPGRGGQARV